MAVKNEESMQVLWQHADVASWCSIMHELADVQADTAA